MHKKTNDQFAPMCLILVLLLAMFTMGIIMKYETQETKVEEISIKEEINNEETIEIEEINNEFISSDCLDTNDANNVTINDNLIYLGEFRLTGYCPCEICCGEWSGGPTYSGAMPTANHTIAVDTDIIPLGSHVLINGAEYVAEDTGSAIIENRIDIYCNTHEECFSAFCNGYTDVYLIEQTGDELDGSK